jgi:uncharacterized protein
VHLSDLHYGFLVPLWFIQHVIDRSNQLKPDLIVCTGDYVHEKNSTTQIDQVCPMRFNCFPEIAVLELVPDTI